MRAGLAALTGAFLLSTQSVADDGSASLAAGGIVFVKSADIRMAREDLAINPKKVRVRFEFVNDGTKDRDVLVAFPLPDIAPGDDPIGTMQPDPVNFVGFGAWVDGKPIAFKTDQRAIFGGRDVTAAVLAAGSPVNIYSGAHDEQGPPEKALGALHKAGIAGWWTVRTRFYWLQRFPARKTVTIEHSYAPVSGVGQYQDNRRADARGDENPVKAFCIDKASVARLAAWDADRARSVLFYSVTGYILKTAATWKGAIGHFHLALDKLDGKAMLALCWNGALKQTGPTTFTYDADNFTPTQDIHMAVIE